MVYKLGHVSDLGMLTSLDRITYDTLYEYLSVLDVEYGESRDIDESDGGYVLYVTPNSTADDIKEYFDYSANVIEHVNRCGDICSAMYILSNEYAVVIVMSIADAPQEISKNFEEGY